MVECGKVIKLAKRNNVTVSFDRKTACDQCHMCAVSKSGKTVEITVPNTVNAEIGDDVLVTMGDRYVLTAALIVYVIPLILVAIGVIVGQQFGVITQLVLVFVALVIGFAFAIFLDKKVIRKKKGFVPEITKILAKASDNAKQEIDESNKTENIEQNIDESNSESLNDESEQNK
ncbi:MAG: SoxR reducing system RseC family protein [Clostridia bacterium]